jgi:hypothetical protein
MSRLGRWWAIVKGWFREVRPPIPDTKGLEASEAVQDRVIEKLETHADAIIQRAIEQEPGLAPRVEDAVRRRQTELDVYVDTIRENRNEDDGRSTRRAV